MLHTTLMRDTTTVLAHTLAVRSLATSLMNVACKLVRIELLPSSDPRSVAPHSMVIIGTVLVATASPQSNIVTTSSDSNKLLPASDPWAVAANPVAFISTPSAVSASSEGNPSTTAPDVELLPASDPWAVAKNPVTFVSTPLAASASSECHSQTVLESS